jgi:hypothetical protein
VVPAHGEEVAMGVLDRFERRLDRLVSGAFARAFKAEVQPVEIAGALQRECDDKAAIVARGRTMVPNEFRVELGPTDFERLATYLTPLSTELADVVREHAVEQGYTVVGPVSVSLRESDELETGVFRVVSEAVPGELPPTLLPNVRLESGGRTIPLTTDQVVIGRGSEADVRLDDAGVSRRHAVIRLSPTPTVSDLGSTNGTLVDGVRTDEADLVDGTTLVVGSTTLVFRYGG